MDSQQSISVVRLNLVPDGRLWGYVFIHIDLYLPNRSIGLNPARGCTLIGQKQSYLANAFR